MHDGMTESPTRPATLEPAPVSLHELWPWLLFALVLLALLYLVGVEGGAASLGPGSFVHELLHDGRHLLAFPCH